MPRFKPVHYDQTVLLPVSLSGQIIPDAFEYTLHHIQRRIDTYIADKLSRKRDSRFAEVDKYKAGHKAEVRQSRHSIYRLAYLAYAPVLRSCICPASHALYQNGRSCWLKEREFVKLPWVKVYIQWKLYCIVPNLVEIHRHGMAANGCRVRRRGHHVSDTTNATSRTRRRE